MHATAPCGDKETSEPVSILAGNKAANGRTIRAERVPLDPIHRMLLLHASLHATHDNHAIRATYESRKCENGRKFRLVNHPHTVEVTGANPVPPIDLRRGWSRILSRILGRPSRSLLR